jgi:SAM-dependent methyltransferase
MAEGEALNSVERFTGLAEMYARNRPSYPPAALEHIFERADLKPGAVLVDVGCGTGISARQFAACGLRVVGIEPNAEMRAQAEAEPAPPAADLTYRASRAEATGLQAGFADIVLSAQAFHWFEEQPALQEFHRILKPHGWAVLMWNETDASDPATAAYRILVHTRDPHYAQAGAVLLTSPLFEDGERVAFANEQWLDEEGLVGRALSVSYAPREPAEVKELVADLRGVFKRFQSDGNLSLRYTTTVYSARRRDTGLASNL